MYRTDVLYATGKGQLSAENIQKSFKIQTRLKAPSSGNRKTGRTETAMWYILGWLWGGPSLPFGSGVNTVRPYRWGTMDLQRPESVAGSVAELQDWGGIP